MSPRSLLLGTLSVSALLLPLLTSAHTIPYFGPILEKGWDTCPLGWDAVIMTINNVIVIAITYAITFLAPAVFAYAGFLLVTNPFNPSAKEKAKSMITNLVIGIVIALSGWMIVDALMAVLYHPSGSTFGAWSDLITGGTKPCIPIATALHPAKPGEGAPGIKTTPGPTGTTPPPAVAGPGQYTHAEALAALQAHGSISLASTGGCSDPNNARCTSLEGIPKDAIASIINIQTKCGCSITIVGGTEVGHKSHGQGLPIVDLDYSGMTLVEGIRAAGYSIDVNFGRGATCEPPGRPGVAMICGSGAGHIHTEL